MATPDRPRLAQNPLTGSGIFLTTVSAAVFLSFFAADLFGIQMNPYFGIIFYLAVPSLFVLGLFLIPAGLVRERRRRLRGLPPTHWHWPRVDMNDAFVRRVVAGVAVLTMVNVIIIGLAAYKGVEYMDSPDFCGRVCHTVMEPEFTAYLDGPHARVRCIECHIGPGAPWFVKSKIDGIRQVWAVTFNTYDRPIPTPVHSLRPARETCEQCHWPDKFTGDLVKSVPSYGNDEANTPSPTTMQIRVGGGGWRFGGPHGIHWHTSAAHKVEYIATDEQREKIPYVRLTDSSGRVTEFTAQGTKPADLSGREVRTMDCVDCHNRPSHRFAQTPERAVDAALQLGGLPQDLPYMRREAVKVLKQQYPDRASADRAIRAQLEGFYAGNYPGLAAAPDPRIARAVLGTQRLFAHNVFPRMRLAWGTHPNHIGHEDSPGCFRCHDEEHSSPGGKTISQDCELCHKVQ